MQRVGGVPIHNYILNQTWFRPRDIIRFFTIIQSFAGEKSFIYQKTFEIVKQHYSEESWIEFEEILTAYYSDQEVDGIRLSLTGMHLPFIIEDFKKSIDAKSDAYETVERLKTKKPIQILKDLYDIGVIGNYGDYPRFSFRGDKDLDPMVPLTFHCPLIRFFKASITSKQKS